jgi:ABC-type amino acid transport substrate-binding protein
MKQQAISTIIAVGVLLTLMMSNPASAQKLTLGNEGTYPPFSIVGTDGRVTGIEPDLAREMCKRMGAECEIVSMDFSALLPSLIAGKIDMIISQLTPLPERLEATEFTLPVVFSPTGFVVHKDWEKGFDNEAMSGMKLGVYKGSSHAKYVEVNLPDAQPVYYDNNDQMALDLLADRIDGVFGDKINWQLLLIDTEDGKDWKLSEDYWETGEREGKHWAAQKGNTELIKIVNEALESIIADCTYTKIRKQYLAVQMLDEESKCM